MAEYKYEIEHIDTGMHEGTVGADDLNMATTLALRKVQVDVLLKRGKRNAPCKVVSVRLATADDDLFGELANEEIRCPHGRRQQEDCGCIVHQIARQNGK